MKQLIIATLLTLSVLTPALKAQASSAQTIKNLNTAFQGESNAANRYTLAAQKAEKDGFAQVAKLFRAAAASEAIHRDNHKEAILKLGGKIDSFQLEAVTLGSTEDNLKAAIKGETYEQDVMYPGFIKTAKAEDARAAVRTLQFAMATEKEHAKLYQQALDQLGKNPPVDYYVCKICGYTVTVLPTKKCPECRQSVKEYFKVS